MYPYTCVLDMCTSLFVYQVAGSGRGPPVFVLQRKENGGKNLCGFSNKQKNKFPIIYLVFLKNTNNVHNARHCIDEGLRCSEQ